MLLKSLAALALAAQASALNVMVYSDSSCSTVYADRIVSQGTCVPGASGVFLAVASGCTGTGSGTTAMVAVVPNADCSGNPLYGGQINGNSCTKLTAATGVTPDLWAMIDSNYDAACGDASKTFSVLNYGDTACGGTPVSGSGVIIADGNCRFRAKTIMNGGLLTTTTYTDSACTTSSNTYAGVTTNGACKSFASVQNGVGSAKATLVNPFPPAPKTSGASETATAAAVVVGAAAAVVMAARA